MTTENRNTLIIKSALLVLVVILSRLIPHAPNLTAIGGVALWAAYSFKNKYLSLGLLFVSLVLSDLVLGFYPGIAFVYISWLAFWIIGSLVQPQSRQSLIFSTLAASGMFFLISNFGMWLQSGFYPMTSEGLIHCYTLAIPFFRNQIIGDVLSGLVLFEVSRVYFKTLVASPVRN